MRSAPTVIQTEHLAPAAARWLAERASVVQAEAGSASFLQAAPLAQALVVRTYTAVNRSLLAGLPALRVVGRAGVGLDNIDLEACRERGIRVVHTPDANTQAVVEYVLCILCDAVRPRLFLERAVDAQRWSQLREETVGERQLSELRLGIMGMGRIGQRVAQVAAAIGCQVAYCDLKEIPESGRWGAAPTSAETLFSTSDVITLHIDGRPSNHGYVGGTLLGRMRANSILVNTCRGIVVDAAALARALRGNPAMMAVLDVHDPEPFPTDYPLLGLPNAHLAPHLASRTASAMDAMSWVVRDVWAVLEGREPQWPA